MHYKGCGIAFSKGKLNFILDAEKCNFSGVASFIRQLVCIFKVVMCQITLYLYIDSALDELRCSCRRH
jgi:hypothetical protein